VGQRFIRQFEQVVAWVGAWAMSKASADPTSLSCLANVCGEAMEVWTDAEAQRPKTLQQPVKEISSSATNGTSSFCIFIEFTSLTVKELFIFRVGRRFTLTKSARSVCSGQSEHHLLRRQQTLHTWPLRAILRYHR